MRDFKYMTRAIRPTSELLVIGQLSLQNKQIQMKAKMIIGSDRMELYEYFGRKTEVRG